jgi:hypothetical protein
VHPALPAARWIPSRPRARGDGMLNGWMRSKFPEAFYSLGWAVLRPCPAASTSALIVQTRLAQVVCMYVDFYISASTWTLTTQGYLGPRQRHQGIQRWYVVTGILMTRSSLPWVSHLLSTGHRPRKSKNLSSKNNAALFSGGTQEACTYYITECSAAQAQPLDDSQYPINAGTK